MSVKNVEGNFRDLLRGTVSEFTYSDWRIPKRTSVSTVCLRTRLSIRNLV